MPAFRFLFWAQDYERSVSFYRDTLRLPVVASWDEEGKRGTIVAAAGGQIEILGPDGASPARVRGAALSWEVSDVDAAIDDLRASGVAIVVEPADRPWGHRSATFADPDGLPITFFTVQTNP